MEEASTAAAEGPTELHEPHRQRGHADRMWVLTWNPAPGPGTGPILAS
jgi:cytosolic iron-sulfur protein assembly protein CIAO1